MFTDWNRVEVIFARRQSLSVNHQAMALMRMESKLYIHQPCACLVGWLTSVSMSKDDSIANLKLRESPVGKANWFIQVSGEVGKQLKADDYLMVVARPVPILLRGGRSAVVFVAELVMDIRNT